MRTRVWAAVLAITASMIGCGKSSGQGPSAGTSATPSSSSSAALAPTPGASSSTSPNPSAARAGSSWSGDYTAKKATVDPGEKVKDLTWKRDPGDKAIGPGKITLSVTAETVTGTANGALGDQVISGTLDGKRLRFSLFPKNAQAPEAMTGTGSGEVGATSITGSLRCTGPDAVQVREASFELKPAQ